MPQKQQAAPVSVANALTVVMVGPTGQGKSTLGNMLSGGSAFSTSDDFDSETLEASHADFAFDLQGFRAIDTIGFLDTRMDHSQNMDKFAGFADRAPGGIDAFLFVLKKGRFTEHSLGQIATFRAIAGEEALKRTILVFTHCGAETNQSLLDRCNATTNQHLRAAMDQCASIVGVDCVAKNRRSDRESVLQAVKGLVVANHGQKYENATLIEARRRREELRERIGRHLSQERREHMEDKLEALFHGRLTFEQVRRAVDDSIEREEADRKAEEERLSMQALLSAARSEAQAWKEVARNVLLVQSGGNTGSSWGNCCGPPLPATYDSCEVRYDDRGLDLGPKQYSRPPG